MYFKRKKDHHELKGAEIELMLSIKTTKDGEGKWQRKRN